MAEKKITRKVISKVPVKEVAEKATEAEETEVKKQEAAPVKKVCFFCNSKTEPTYVDTNTLRRFVSDRAKISPRSKTSLCARHQRGLTRQIKYARHLSLLPFTPSV